MATIREVISRGSKNRLVRTEGFDDATKWLQLGSPTITANDAGTLDPLGGTTADLINDATTLQTSSVYQEVLAAELTTNDYYTFSVFLKPNTSAKSMVYLIHQGSSIEAVYAEITWATLAVVKTLDGTHVFSKADLRDAGNGFYRLSVTIRWLGGANTKLRGVIVAASGGIAQTGSVWAWGAQFERGSSPTAYNAVTAATDPLAGTYRTIPEFITATAADVTNIRIGQLRDETYLVSSENIIFNRGTSTSTVYRGLEPADGVGAYNPVTNTGPRIVCTFGVVSAGTKIAAVKLQENFVDLNGVGIFLDYSARGNAGDMIGIRIDGADYCRIWDCFLSMERGGGDLSLSNDTRIYGVYVDGTPTTNPAIGNSFFDVIVKGSGLRSNRGCDTAFFYGADAQLGGFYGCIAHGCGTYATGRNGGCGFFSGHVSPGSEANSAELVNCVVTDGITTSLVGFWKRARNNITFDAVALSEGLEGTGKPADPLSRNYISATSLFLAAEQQNFRPRAGGAQLDAGSNETATYTAARSASASGGPGTSKDLLGVTRPTVASGSFWDIGPYEGAPTQPLHCLSEKLVVSTTGATSSENGDGDSFLRVKSTGTGLLAAGDVLTVVGAAGTYAVVNPIYFVGTATVPDTQNVRVTPVLSVTGSLANNAGIDVRSGSGSFTTITKTIGLDRSRDYDSLSAAVRDLPRNLYQLNQKYILSVYDDGVDEVPETIELDYFNVIAGPANSVEVRAAGKFYDPRTNVGPRIKCDVGTASQARHRAVLWSTLSWLKLQGLRFEQAATSTVTTKNPRAVELWADDVVVDACFGIFAGTYSRFIGTGWEVEGSRITLENVISRGSDTLGQGASRGFQITGDSRDCRLLHCVAYRIRGGTDTGGTQQAAGFFVAAGAVNAQISGSVSLETDTAGTGGKADFGFGAGVTAAQVLDHSFSSDSTAVGIGSLQSQTASVVFSNASLNDFRLKIGSPAVNAGGNLSRVFSTDFAGKPRFAPFDVGVYEGLATAALLGTPQPRDHHRLATLWEITRSDGVVHFFSSLNEPLPFQGQIYLPAGQTVASARRMDAALREHNTEIVGAIVSGSLDAEDLAADLFRGARVVLRVIDWRFPWAAPSRTRIYTIAQTEFDQDVYTAELVGPTARLDQRVGESIGTDCPYTLFDDDCQLLASLYREVNRTVSTVTNARREFTCSGLSSSVDDFYGKGKITVIDGPNAGLELEIKSYIGATKTIKLLDPAPFDFGVGNRFDIIPGCRRRYLKDCILKYGNGINFGGRPHLPNTDRSMETPTR